MQPIRKSAYKINAPDGLGATGFQYDRKQAQAPQLLVVQAQMPRVCTGVSMLTPTVVSSTFQQFKRPAFSST
jgi:hypothetical protein